MTTEIRNENDSIIAVFNGRLDTAAAVQTAKDVEPLMQTDKKNVILDCSKLEYISSSGLRIFISILKVVKPKGGQVTIQHINSEIAKVLQMTGFDKLFIIQP